MPLSAGDKLGPYEILGLIGAGGMGEVYKGYDTRLGRVVAIKVSKEQFSERFEREARAIAALNHPNICQIYDVGSNYLVLEYVEGMPVAPLDSPRKLLDVAIQIADGLAAAHAAKFVHRDLKRDNILVTREGRVKILDFGLAKQASSAAAATDDATRTIALTGFGTVLGTVAYMSPEQARGKSDVGPQSDQFSLGLILYELAAAKRAFRRDSAAETMTAIIREDPEPLPFAVPAPLRWVVHRCLAKEAGERYESTRDLYWELRQAREHLSEVMQLPVVGPERAGKRQPWLAWGSAVVLVAVIFAIAFWPIQLPELAQLIPFATESELQVTPRWSPDGDRIAYVAAVDGVLQVFTKSLGSFTPTQITHEKQSCLSPMWSADGTRIYYLVGRLPNTSLWSIAVAGGASEKVLDGVSRADLSPDGRTLAVLALVPDAPGQYRLAFSSPPGAPPQAYSRAPLSEFRNSAVTTWPQFDRSGKYLALFTNERSSRNEFWKIPLDGGPPQEMLGGRARAPFFHFAWLEDGERIVSDATISSAESHLSVIDLSTAAARTITAGASRDGFPALAPSGRTLAFASGELGFDIIEVPVDGSAPQDVVAAARGEVAPAWAPDGIRFAYITDRSGEPEIWLRNRADGSERLLVSSRQIPGVHALLDSAISADGAHIAYRAQAKGEFAIWISPLAGEGAVQLWNDPSKSPQRGPSWSPDGNWIAYYGATDGRPAVMKTRVGANGPGQLLAYMSRPQPVRWSPRGDSILFQDGETLRIVSPDGKQNSVISQRRWETYGWSRDGTAVYGIVSSESRHLVLEKIDIGNDFETRIADLGPVPPAFDLEGAVLNEFPYRGFSLHPNGKSFLTSVLRVKAQIYLMKDFDKRFRFADRWFRP